MIAFFIGLRLWQWVADMKRKWRTGMRIEFLDDAGNRITDGSSIGYAVVTALQGWIAMYFGPMTTQQMLMLAATVIGWCFKFIRVVP